jgi:hypothetical protein
MEKSSQIAWKSVPLRHFFPLKVVPLIEVLLYFLGGAGYLRYLGRFERKRETSTINPSDRSYWARKLYTKLRATFRFDLTTGIVDKLEDVGGSPA